MSISLTGQTAVVTGGASGIGRATARRLADHGADVVIADIQAQPRDGGAPTHDRIAEETDVDARFVECDVTDWNAVCEAVATADAMGGLDVMVNNAGIIRTGPLTDLTESDFDAVIDVNLKGVFFGSKAATVSFRERDVDGTIINLSSISGLVGGAENSLYCATKGAVRLFTYALADELGPHGICVNAVHPGPVQTKLIGDDVSIVGTNREDAYRRSIPLGRFGRAEEVADAILYLASDLAGFTTGTSLVLDGGISNTGGVSQVPDGS